MPSQALNRILIDTGVDTHKLQKWYDEGKAQVDAKGWSPNESRYQAWCHRYAERKAIALGCKKLQAGGADAAGANGGSNGNNAHQSLALRALIKSVLSEIEAEARGIYLG